VLRVADGFVAGACGAAGAAPMTTHAEKTVTTTNARQAITWSSVALVLERQEAIERLLRALRLSKPGIRLPQLVMDVGILRGQLSRRFEMGGGFVGGGPWSAGSCPAGTRASAKSGFARSTMRR